MNESAVRALEFINLFCVGLLAGLDFVVCYAVRRSIHTLDESSQIRLRQALIRRLRILAPALFFPAFLSGLALMISEWGNGFPVPCAGMACLVAWISITLTGTMPINKAALEWNPDAPPGNWIALVRRWERLDIVRTWVVVASFATFVIAVLK